MKKLLFIYLLFVSGTALAQHNNFKAYSIEQGLSQSNVYSVMQDSKGYLWVGTAGGGVSRFDGKEFKNYDQNDGLSGNTIRSIVEDSHGHLWIGTDGGLTFYDGLQFRVLTQDSGLSGSNVLRVYEDSKSNIWVGTDDGGVNLVKRNDDGTFYISSLTADQGLSDNSVFGIFEDKFNRIWIGTFGGISVLTLPENADSLSQADIEYLKGGIDIPGEMILYIEEDQSGDIWIGTYGAGVMKIRYTEEELAAEVKHYMPVDTFKVFPATIVWSIESRSNGEVWFGTDKHGVIRYNGSEFINYNTSHGLPNNQVMAILEDKEELMWFGTNGNGLVKLFGDHFSHYSVEDGLSDNKVQGLQQDGLGNFWIVSNGGGLSKLYFNNGVPRFQNFTESEGMPSNFCTSVALERSTNPNIWISTTNQGIVKFDGEKFTNYTENDDLQHNWVYDLYVDNHGIVWCGTADGISRYDGVTFLNYSTEDMMMTDQGVNAIIQDKHGSIWFGTAGGLARYDRQGTMRTFDEVEGLTDKYVNTLTEGPEGNIWIGTNGGGLYVFDPKSNDSLMIRQVAGEGVLSSNSVNSLIFTAGGELIIGTDKGFDRAVINNMKISRVRSYNSSDGFFGVECQNNAVYKDYKGRIWIGTVKGLTMYDPSKENRERTPPQVYVTDIRLQFKEVDWKEKAEQISPWFMLPKNLELPHYEKHLTFYFDGLAFENPDKVKYRYMLEGLDNDWSPASAESKATYSGLTHGKYTFKVMAANADGKWSEPASFDFVITPPWYQTTWFYSLCVIALITGIYLFVKIREKSLKQEKEILENKVQERTREVVMQKEEIEEKNREITDSINYAKRLQDAILPPDEMIKKHLPHSFVLFRPKDIVSGDFYWMDNKDNKVIFTAADCTGHGVPGAFVSIVGANGLRRAVNEFGLRKPGEILDKLNELVEETFTQNTTTAVKDGMDIALSVIDVDAKQLHFAGANNPLYLIRKKAQGPLKNESEELEPNMEEGDLVLYEIKADKQPIGSFDDRKSFTNHALEMKEGDAVFLFSDGFADQFGGPKGKKFKYKPFKKLLIDIYNKPAEEQKNILNDTIEEWMGVGNFDQIDDVCVFGVKF